MIAVIRGPYSRRRRHTLRRAAARRSPTGAATRNELMLGDPHRYWGQVEHLIPLQAHLGCVRQICAAIHARAGLVPLPLVRVGDQRQRRPRMPGLPTRLASTLAPQRLRRGLHERRVRRWRLRRVSLFCPNCRRNSATSPPQLDHHRTQLTDHLPQPGVLRNKVLIGRTRIGRHTAMINKPPRKINQARRTTPNQLPWKLVRFADDFVILVRGTREDTEALWD
jgi:hypothetical protein